MRIDRSFERSMILSIKSQIQFNAFNKKVNFFKAFIYLNILGLNFLKNLLSLTNRLVMMKVISDAVVTSERAQKIKQYWSIDNSRDK